MLVTWICISLLLVLVSIGSFCPEFAVYTVYSGGRIRCLHISLKCHLVEFEDFERQRVSLEFGLGGNGENIVFTALKQSSHTT